MSGIAGFIGNYQPSLLSLMQDALRHRGRDDSSKIYFPEPQIGLVHTDLLSSSQDKQGRQPLWDASQQCCIVFDGIIFNFQALKDKLSAIGFTFNTQNTAEMILNLYIRYGVDCLDFLEGNFSFCILDRRADQLFLARDVQGVKPLYYAKHYNGFIFASEIKAILQEPSISRDLDHEALQLYMTYLWAPAPYTPLREVRKLAPGHAMLVSRKGIEKKWQYADLPYNEPVAHKISLQDAAKKTYHTLETAIKKQIQPKTPTGLFLSGDLNSSALAAITQRHLGEQQLPCFTISNNSHAPGSHHNDHSLERAQRVATHIGSSLEVVHVEDNVCDFLDFMIYHLDEPQPSLAGLNIHYMASHAQEQGIKSMMTGLGADALFAGYQRHTKLSQEHLITRYPVFLRRAMKYSSNLLPQSVPATRNLARTLQYAPLEGDERLVSYFYNLNPSRVPLLFSKHVRSSLTAKHPSTPLRSSLHRLKKSNKRCPQMHRMLYLETKHYLADNCLNYTDKMCMAAGVEYTAPYLDPELIKLAAKLPPHLKQHNGVGKYVLRHALEKHLPKEIIYGPNQPTQWPLRAWLNGPLKEIVNETLSPQSLKNRGLFDANEVQKLLKQNKRGQIDASYSIFAMVCIERWCRMFIG